MKRRILFIMVLGVCAALVSAEKTASQKSVVGKGCVGECGASATVEYTVPAGLDKKIIVKTVETSLCANTGAFAFLFKNGVEVANGSITKKDAYIKTKAAPGDKIAVYVTTYPLFNGIVCVRLGELKFELIEYAKMEKSKKKGY